MPRRKKIPISAQAENDRFQRFTIPTKLKCVKCNKIKHQSNYSKRKLEDFKIRFFANGPRDESEAIARGWIPCQMCTAAQTTELECADCGKVKDLEQFAKAQRRNPDNARCQECMESHLNLEPGMRYREHPPSDSDESDSEDGETQADYDGTDEIRTRTENMSLSSSQIQVNEALPAGEWHQQPPRRTFGTSQTASGRAYGTQAPSMSKFNPHAYGKPKGPGSVAGSVMSGGGQSSTSRSKWKPNQKMPSKTQAALQAQAEEEPLAEDSDKNDSDLPGIDSDDD